MKSIFFKFFPRVLEELPWFVLPFRKSLEINLLPFYGHFVYERGFSRVKIQTRANLLDKSVK